MLVQRSLKLRLRARVIGAALLAALALASCGGGSNDLRSELGKRSLVDISALPGLFITDRDRRTFKPGTPQRAFLNYWSSLQFQDWNTALAAFDPRLTSFIGVPRLIPALRAQNSLFVQTKPYVVATFGNRSVSIRYAFRNSSGDVLVHTTVWRKEAGGWKMLYDSFLDTALQDQAQSAVQDAIDPSAGKPARRAVQAGDAAAQLQPRFLQSLGGASAFSSRP